MKHLKFFKATETCADYNSTLAKEWEALENNGVKTMIVDRDCEDVNKNTGTYLNAYYPYNLMLRIFGREKEWVGEHNEIVEATDKTINKFSGKEKLFLELVFKQRVSDLEARKQLGLSREEYMKLRINVMDKFNNPNFTWMLEKFVSERDDSKNCDILSTVKERLKIVEKNT